MDNTIKVIETKKPTPFGDLRKRSTYIPTPINVSGGIYLSDRETAKDDLVIEELFLMYIAGQTFGEIVVDGKEISFDIIFEFKDVNGNVILPQEMNIALLYNIIYAEIMGIEQKAFCTYEIKTEYYLDERQINEKESDEVKEPEYVPTLGNCKMKRKNACAYCSLHNCYLSVKQMRKRDCINRDCKHLQKEEHAFWDNQGLKLLNNKGDKNNE